MNFNSKFLLIVLSILIFGALTSNAQEDTMPDLEEIVEEIASSTDVDLDYTTLFNTLENLYYYPLDLNTATKEDLDALIFLTEFQIYSIIDYRKKYGNYKTLYELQFVDGIDTQTLKRILAFVAINKDEQKQKISLNKAFSYGKHDIITRYQRLLQEKTGYNIADSLIEANPNKSRYLGSPDKFYLKYGYQYKTKLSYGITAEKDDGEQFFRGAQKYGFDFYSAHFQINDLGIVKKIIVGDYLAQFGQGLTMWSGLTFGKTTNVANIIKKPRGVNKYTSVNESAFLRGQAVTLKFGDFAFTEFVSYKRIDGGTETTNDTIENEIEQITSFLESGYHRTPSEVEKRKSIKEFIAGGNLTWTGTKLKLGLTGVYYSYSSPFVGNNKPYTHFNFTGKSNFNLGIDYLLTLKKIHIFGETSISQNLGFATINGVVVDFVPEFKMSVLHRYLHHKYQALYAQPFSEGNKPSNESGIFIGAEIYPVKNWKIDLYIDSWKYPWLSYNVNGPSTGMEYVAQLSYYPRRDLDMYAKIKYETKKKNNTEVDNGVVPLISYSTVKIRYHINYSVSNNWKLKTRLELSNYSLKDDKQWGYLVYQDIQYALHKVPLTFILRTAVFETESYDDRIYAYEPDILYGFSVPAYYGRGSRLIFVVKYSIIKNIDLWFRIANTYYHDKDGLGSGLDAIEGQNRTDIKLQLRLKF
ncbi:helix-hairpin-helix domain-containing protein [Bacteroidales bacterium OttesenSCG-928-I21]|nr:helix-hairpin-helix domain-containing protein [Bacteroidales bacterium OttesenSCG-928-I21]